MTIGEGGYDVDMHIEAIYNTRLVQEHIVRDMVRHGFKIVTTADNHDITLSKAGTECIIDAKGNVRYINGKTDDSRPSSN